MFPAVFIITLTSYLSVFPFADETMILIRICFPPGDGADEPQYIKKLDIFLEGSSLPKISTSTRTTTQPPVDVSIEYIEKKDINILDLSPPLLEKIVQYSFLSYRNRQKSAAPSIHFVVELSKTCKQFRAAVQKCLTDDSMWVNRFRGEFCEGCFTQSCVCPFYRHSWKSEYPQHGIRERCQSCGPCRNANAIMTFYRLACSLQKVNLKGLFLTMRLQDARYIVRYLTRTKPPIREICFHWYASRFIPKYNTSLKVLEKLFHSVSRTLQTISIDGYVLCKTKILNTICEVPLPNITRIDFSSDSEQIDGMVAMAAKLVIHCVRSGAKLESVNWSSREEIVEFLEMECVKPHLHYLSQSETKIKVVMS